MQIGNTGRALKESEVTKYGLETFPFAIERVAVAVNPANAVTSLTKAQVKDVFAGKITNWKELGGKDAPISLYVREDGSGTRETFEERALDKGTSVQSANVVNSNGAMKTAIAQGSQRHRLCGHRASGFLHPRRHGGRHGSPRRKTLRTAPTRSPVFCT